MGDASPKDSSVDIVISHAAAGKGRQKESSTDPKKACDECKKFHPKLSFTPADWQGRGVCQICRNRYAKISHSLARALSLRLCVLVTEESVSLGRQNEKDREKTRRNLTC